MGKGWGFAVEGRVGAVLCKLRLWYVEFLVPIFQLVSKKTTHRPSVENGLNLWFFLPLPPQKIHIFCGYDILKSPKGKTKNSTEGNTNHLKFLHRFKVCVRIKMSRGTPRKAL